MAKFEIPSVLSRVRVKSPCSQDWNTMRGNDQVRFCDHCAKHVHNLSEMTPEAALELVEQSEGRLCVRFAPDTTEAPTFKSQMESGVGGFRLPTLRVAAGVLVAALSGGVASAGTVPVQTPSVLTPVRPIMPTSGMGAIDLVVTFAPNIRYVNLPAKLVNEKTGETMQAVSDPDGHIRFTDVPFGVYFCEIKTALFSTEIRFEVFEEAVRELKEDVGFNIMGQVSISSIRLESEEWVNHSQQRAAESVNKGIVYADINLKLAELELERAVATEDVKKAQAVLEQGFDLTRRTSRFDDPYLHRLLQRLPEKPTRKTDRLLERLAAAGADFNATNRFGVTALMTAALGSAGRSGALIRAGANVNAADDNGRTALMFAVFNGEADVVELLVRAGANVNARDTQGQSVSSYLRPGADSYAREVKGWGDRLVGDDLKHRKRILNILKHAGAVE
jgi:hypothetical protein